MISDNPKHISYLWRRLIFLVAGLAASSCLALGCQSDLGVDEATFACGGQSDCADGFQCHQGRCLRPGQIGADTGDAEVDADADTGEDADPLEVCKQHSGCEEYCRDYMDVCVGPVFDDPDDPRSFEDIEECCEVCSWYPEKDPAGSNTRGCRGIHVTNTPPEGHCPHASPEGAGMCGETTRICLEYCAKLLRDCDGEAAQFREDVHACLAACGEYPADGQVGDATGNTVQCRMTQRSNAIEQLDSFDREDEWRKYCHYAGPDSTVCCECVGPEFDEADQTPVVDDREAPTRFGAVVANIGDFNGDGLADFAVGAPDGLQNGAVHIYFGKNNRLGPEADLTITGAEDNSKFGSSIASVPDLDGDGRPDLLVGAPNFPGGSTSGAAYVVYSEATMEQGGDVLSVRDDASASPWFSTLMPEAGEADGFGAAVAALDDADGPVLVVSAVPEGVDSATPTGQTTVYLIRDIDPTSPTVQVGEPEGNIATVTHADGIDFGRVLANVGDVFGEGSEHLAISDPHQELNSSQGLEPGAGEVFVLRDLPASGNNLEISSGGDFVHIKPEFPTELGRFGAAIAGGADLTGDGIADLAVGEPGLAAGRVATFSIHDDVNRLASLVGEQDGDRLGEAVAMHQVDCDNYGLIVGAPGAPDELSNAQAGRVYVGVDGTDQAVGSIDGHKLGSFTGAERQRLGASVAALGDTNGDWRDDLAWGAPGVAGFDQGGVVRLAYPSFCE